MSSNIKQDRDQWSGQVSPEAEGERLDRFLADAVPGLSRTAAARAVKLGLVQVDGAVCSQVSLKLVAGQQVEFQAPPVQETTLQAEEIPLQVLFEDEWLAVINKDPGLVVHPAKGHPDGTLVNGLMHRWGVEDPEGRGRPGLVHRLDMGTGGLMVVARNEQVLEQLQAQFKDRTVRKIYLAVVVGVPKTDHGVIDRPITRHPRDRKRYTSIKEEGRAAVTDWAVLARGDGVSLLGVRLHTGRTHQIRVHMADEGFPLVGDEVYGGRWLQRIPTGPSRSFCSPASRPMLHSALLEFVHPVSGVRQGWFCPPHPDMARLIRKLFDLEVDGMEAATLLAAVKKP